MPTPAMPEQMEPSEALAASSIITISCGDGAKARVHLNGAHVTSWVPAGANDERLFVSAKSGFGPGVSIRGGIPICFPQFGVEGPLPQHGFARVSVWTLLGITEEAHTARAVFRLVDNDATRATWPHAFSAELTVTIGGASLETALAVTNLDGTNDSATADAFIFTAALHPYFRVADAFACSVSGLAGLTYRDALRNRELVTESRASLEVRGEMDRVYFAAPGVVRLVEPDRALAMHREGFPDVVVWNPGATGVARREDFHEGDERRFVCVEAAAVVEPITLPPGATWTGVMTVHAER